MRINKNWISNGVKTKNLVIIFILFLLITLASASAVFLTEEKGRLSLNEQSSVIEKQAEPVVNEPAEAAPQLPEKNATPPTPPSGILGTGLVREEEKVEPPPAVSVVTEEKINAVMIIDGVKYEAAVKPNSSAYDLMNLLKVENKINFSGRNYAELGFFIEEINGLKNNPAGANWLYYVNGQPAQVGVSYYLIKANDIIEWKYENKSF